MSAETVEQLTKDQLGASVDVNQILRYLNEFTDEPAKRRRNASVYKFACGISARAASTAASSGGSGFSHSNS